MHLQERVMRMFDVQGIEIVATRARVFEFVRKPGNLPQRDSSAARRILGGFSQ